MLYPKITVIIPTRERADVLHASLRTVTSQNYDGLEILVSDNDSQDATKDVVRSFTDERLHYVNTGRRLSMSKNWEFALQHVTDGWVTIIGDDDGLLPDSLRSVGDTILASGANAVRSRVCSYFWPSALGEPFGRLSVPLGSGTEIRNSRHWLDRVLSGGRSYTDLPMLYNGGYVSVSVLKEIKAKTGSVYNSCIPDVYSALAIGSVLDSYAFMREPTAINGASEHSTGTSTFAEGASKAGTPAAKFVSEENMRFHDDVPLSADGTYPTSLQALVYESYLQSRQLRPGSSLASPEQQLGVILATSGTRAQKVQEWAHLFADRHRLNYDKIFSRAKIERYGVELVRASRLLAAQLNTCSVGSPELPIKTVYEASLLAKDIWRNPPSRWLRPLQVMQRLLEKRRQRAS